MTGGEHFLKINLSNIRVGNVNVDLRRFSLSANHQSVNNGGCKARGGWFSFGDDLGKVSYAGWLHGPVLGVTSIL